MPKRVSLTMSDEDYARFLALARHHRRTIGQQILASLDSSYRASQKYLEPLAGSSFAPGVNHLVDAKSLYEVAAGE
jgi:hypothetical protein